MTPPSAASRPGRTDGHIAYSTVTDGPPPTPNAERADAVGAGGTAAHAGAVVIGVFGTPAPQGSKRHVGRGIMVESSKRVRPWREAVKHAALDVLGDDWTPLDGPVSLHVTFGLPRPKGHYRTGRNAHLLRDGAPAHPAGKPDVDKLLRSTLDALGEAGVWGDDAQVVHVTAAKAYESRPGAWITVRRMP